jgi:hypothetical protein
MAGGKRLPRAAKALGILLWKNFLLKRRRWKATVGEIIMPVFIFTIVVWFAPREGCENEHKSLTPLLQFFVIFQHILCSILSRARTKIPLEPTPSYMKSPYALPSAGLGPYIATYVCRGDALATSDNSQSDSFKPSIINELQADLLAANITAGTLDDVLSAVDENWAATSVYFSWLDNATLTRLRACVGRWRLATAMYSAPLLQDGEEMHASEMVARASREFEILSSAIECLNEVRGGREWNASLFLPVMSPFYLLCSRCSRLLHHQTARQICSGALQAQPCRTPRTTPPSQQSCLV